MPEAYDFFKEDISSDSEIKRIELENSASLWVILRSLRLFFNKKNILLIKTRLLL
jgi:hypothetical protein